ncbi:MAG: hypothetical protein L6416_02495 [Candidatus Omnitrophica bacterium]|nr:hypothetical protein [Candidatus Omnitrophota bacterium]
MEEKTYKFNVTHDKNKPAQIWFQESDEGLILFTVFYTQACRWSRCIGCNLPSKMSKEHIGYKTLIAQIDHVFNNPEVIQQRKSVKKIIISNNGSVLDEETFSSTALIYLMAKLNLNFPNLSVVSMESRPEFVEVEELDFLGRVLKEGDTPTELEIAVGIEAFDERIRNDIFQKGLSFELFENFVKKIAPYKFRLKCYFMQKPVPQMSDADAVNDIKQGIDYLSSIAAQYNLRINMHLNPTFAAKGTPMEKSFKEGKYTPPKLIDVAKAAHSGKDKNISIFIGLYDEGLAVEGGSFIRPGDEKLVEHLELFNKTQDYNILQDILPETG